MLTSALRPLPDIASAKAGLTSVTVSGAPPWLPPSLAHRPKPVRVSFRASEAERNIYRKRKRIPVSRWAEKYRVVTRGPLEGTPWRNRTTPYLAGIMDVSFFPGVEEIYVCAPPQVGKSALIDTCIGYTIDLAPGPAIYIYPKEDDAKENMKDRILPMIRMSPQLRHYLTGSVDDEASKRVNLQHMQIYMGWAHSASSLGNRSIRHAVADETDKYPDTANLREASPIDLLRKRQRTYRYSRRLWAISTPTVETGTIWVLLTKEAQAVFDYWVRCPICRKFQLMVFAQIRWDKEVNDPNEVLSRDLARYECGHCKSLWDDHQRDLAVRRGHWRERKTGRKLFPYLKENRPKKIGFHLRSWISHFVGLSEVAAAWLQAQSDKTKMKDFQNGHAAEPWKDHTVERQEDIILKLRDERPRGLVPSGGVVSCLTAGVDTQKWGFWYEIRAWGYGSFALVPGESRDKLIPAAQGLESWQIREGYVESWGALLQLLFEDGYYDIDGNEYRVLRAVQDAMGIKERTVEVYDMARLYRNLLIAFKGEQRMATPTAWSKIDVYPNTNKPIPGGIRLLRADTNFFKNQLAAKLEVAPADPGAFHFHSEFPEAWARHFCAEYTDEKGLWQCPEGKANHLWDTSVYNLVAAHELGVRFMRNPNAPSSDGPPRPRVTVRSKFAAR